MGRVGKVKTTTGSSSANRKAARRREQRKAERKKVKRAERKRRRSHGDDDGGAGGAGASDDRGGNTSKTKVRRRDSKDSGKDDVTSTKNNNVAPSDGDSASEMGDELQMTERQLLGILRRSAPPALAARRGVLAKANIAIPGEVEQVHKYLEQQQGDSEQGKGKSQVLSAGLPRCDVVVGPDSVHTVGLYLAPYNMPELVWTRLPNAPDLTTIMSTDEWRETAQSIANNLRVHYGKDAMTSVAQGPEAEEEEAELGAGSGMVGDGRLDHLQVNGEGPQDVTYVFTAMDPLQVPQSLCTFYLYYGSGDDIFDRQAALPGDDEDSDWDPELARVAHPVPVHLTVLQCLLGDNECQNISQFISSDSK